MPFEPRQHKPTGLQTSPSSWALLSLTDAFNITTGVDPLTVIDGIFHSLLLPRWVLKKIASLSGLSIIFLRQAKMFKGNGET